MLASYRILPILGLKTGVSAHDPTLLQLIDDGVALSHDVGGVNVDYRRLRGSCSKSHGYVQFSNSANGQATKCLGLLELYDGTNRNHFIFDNGKCYNYDGNRNPVLLEDAASTTFNTTTNEQYCMLTFGGYMIFTDYGNHTPYKWKHGDSNLTKLIQSGTEYKFRYLEEFQRRIIGAYSDQTNGDIEIRWTDPLPTWASLDFASGHQLYKPQGDDSITGLKKMGSNSLYIYGESSISRLDYYPDASAPFGMVTMISGQGCTNHHSIVSVGQRHFLFNRDYGFCEYNGGFEFPSGGRPISEDIEIDIAAMNSDYYGAIVGTFVPMTQEICWAVPLSGDTTPSHLLFYHIKDRTWRKEDKAMYYVDTWLTYSSYTWNDFISDIGGTSSLWSDATTYTFSKYAAQLHRLVYANTDGHVYYQSSEAKAGAALNGYRIEPILSFGDEVNRDLLLEIWFGLAYTGDFSIDVYWRGGETVGECLDSVWTALTSVDCNDPSAAVSYCNQIARFHQIKWGTDAADERFVVNDITFKYVRQGPY